jgi:hypothetical protein
MNYGEDEREVWENFCNFTTIIVFEIFEGSSKFEFVANCTVDIFTKIYLFVKMGKEESKS